MNSQKMRFAALVLAAGLSGTAQATTSYSVIALHTNDLVNNSGQVVGSSTLTGYSGALLLSTTPVLEPETYAMLLAGLGLVSFASRRRATMQ